MNKNEGVDHWSDTEKFFEDGCPFCKSKEFLEGPHGGLSINFKCGKCGARFNCMHLFGIDLLSEPETECKNIVEASQAKGGMNYEL